MLRVVRPGGRVVCLEISHPPGKIFGTLFHFYFYRFAPLFGTIIGKAFEEYNYLPNSLTTFPDAPALKAIMEEVGWSDVRFYRLSRGIVAVHVGTKPEGPHHTSPIKAARIAGKNLRDHSLTSAGEVITQVVNPLPALSPALLLPPHLAPEKHRSPLSRSILLLLPALFQYLH